MRLYAAQGGLVRVNVPSAANTTSGHSLDHVLRLRDSRTDAVGSVTPMRPSLLRVCAHVPGGSGSDSALTSLRVMLVADLVTRTAEVGGTQAVTGHVVSNRQTALWLAATGVDPESLGIHPPVASAATVGELPPPFDSPADVNVISPGVLADPGWSGLWTAVGAVHRGSGKTGGPLDAAGHHAGHDGDALAVRLALLSFPYYEPADLSGEVLSRARDRLADWVRGVANWAECPSIPVPARVMAKMRAALDTLDAASLIGLLDSLEADRGTPEGAMFETFVFADRVLGLDLTRQVGQPQD